MTIPLGKFLRVILSTVSEYVLDSVFFLFPSPSLVLKYLFILFIYLAASGVGYSTRYLQCIMRDLSSWGGARTLWLWPTVSGVVAHGL